MPGGTAILFDLQQYRLLAIFYLSGVTPGQMLETKRRLWF